MANEKKQQNNWMLLSVFIVLSLTIGFWMQTHANKKHAYQSHYSSTLPISVPIKAFHLTDDEGRAFTNNNLMGHWSLIFFGYSNCPDLCPTTLSKLNKAYEILQASQTHMAPQIVFITIDPKHDTPIQLRQYLSKFNQNFIGVTGNAKEIADLTKSMGIAYNNDYHSGIIIVVNPKAEWVALIRTPASGKEIAKDFEAIQKTL